MIKLFLGVLFLIFSLEARENPFFPSAGEIDLPISSNQVKSIPPLKQASITFPSTARTIESVTVRYKNLDGSIDEKTEELGNAVDWHLPLFISQNYMSKVQESKKIDKKYKKIMQLKFLSVYEEKNELKIITKDKMIRNFLLTKPHRIVCDFSREINVRGLEKEIGKNSIVERIRIGNHKGYYRVVFELDGYYKYTTTKINKGYFFKFL